MSADVEPAFERAYSLAGTVEHAFASTRAGTLVCS